MIFHQKKSLWRLSILPLMLPMVLMPVHAKDNGFLSSDVEGSTTAGELFSKEEAKHKDGWSGEASAGLVVSTGNADNSTITVGAKAKYHKGVWLHTLTGNIYSAENDGEKTAERYAVSHKLNYSMSEKAYLFNFINIDSDEFSDIDLRIANVVGYGRTLLDTERHDLDAEVGVGYRQTKYTTDQDDLKETVGHIGAHYTGKLTDTTTLNEDLMIQGGGDNVFSESITSLKVAMTEKLSLSLNYTIRNNSDVLADVEKTDTITSINLAADF